MPNCRNALVAPPSWDELAKFEDGKIISRQGDFTCKVQRYEFKTRAGSFVVLDLPGIEGAETSVIAKIERAVQTAHVVFYITNESRPPQKGDQKKGTLEKISEHLGDQTRVWAIYNKRINNPFQLAGLSDEERRGLQALDEVLCGQLGHHYQGSIALSAGPVFWAKGSCFLKDTTNYKKREKFLGKFHSDAILRKSKVGDFIDFVQSKLVQNSNSIIKGANHNKIKVRIDDFAARLDAEGQKLQDLFNEWERENQDVEEQINISLKGMKRKGKAILDEKVDEFVTELRKKVYARIERGIKNKELKGLLESCFKAEMPKLDQSLISGREKLEEQLRKDIEEIIEQSTRRKLDFVVEYQAESSIKWEQIDFSIPIKSGINFLDFAILTGGTFFLILTRGKPIKFLALSMLHALINITKAVFPDKKAQQRNEVDKVLLQIKRVADIQSFLSEYYAEISEKLEEDLQKQKQNSQNLKNMVHTLHRSKENLEIFAGELAR